MSVPRRGSNLAVRILTAAVGIPLVLIVNYLGGWLFACVAGIAAVLGTAEFYAMCRRAGFYPLAIPGYCAAACLCAIPLFVKHPQTAWVGIIVLTLCTTGAIYLVPKSGSVLLLSWSLTVVGVLYVGLLLGHLSLLRSLHKGAWWFLGALVMTWAYDTGAYAAGRTLGRRPFMHHISPKKTVEGVLGGLTVSALSSVVLVPAVGIAIWQAVALGLGVGVVSQTGDLAESMMKRQTGVKDSGTLIPGHGGLLDRIDSLLFSGTLTAYAALALGYGS